ncbi:MAG: hypothetical protein KAX38_10015, partial [Candidatus Krumholzibacteria bacterium]|nr:hypothetical protein [Candidatus Krumholzibacteria bacterium]
MFKGKVLLFSLLLVFATSVYAGDVDDCFSYVYLSCDAMRLSICPNGDFEYIRDACVGGGSGGYIGVVAKNASNQGVPGIPWSDYWIGACDPAY